MLSRRNIRIKIMQLLYGATVSERTLTPKIAENLYREQVSRSYDAFLFTLEQMSRIIGYTERDAAVQLKKLTRQLTDDDFNDRFMRNDIAQLLLKSNPLFEAVKSKLLNVYIDADLTRKYYNEFKKTDAFVAYSQAIDVQTDENHRAILLDLVRFLFANDAFIDKLDDHFATWEDDKSLIIGAIKRVIKGLPLQTDFVSRYQPDEPTVGEFGSLLLFNVVSYSTEIEDLIKPKLQNWDIERVTIIDKIFLTMATAEALYCPTIPTNVTLDEYIELSKLYSTERSKEFINGVLDGLFKDLETQGRIRKIDRSTAFEA